MKTKNAISTTLIVCIVMLLLSLLSCNKQESKSQNSQQSESITLNPEEGNKQSQLTDTVGGVTLRMLVWEGYTPSGIVQRFESLMKEKYQFDVKLDIKYLSNPNDFYTAIRAKEADLITPAHDLLKDAQFSYIEKGLVLPVNLDNVPNYKHILPVLKKAPYISSQDKIYGVPIGHGPYGLGYNSNLIEQPNSWSVFWDPKFAGKYTLSHGYYQVNIYITALTLGYKREDLNNYDKINTTELKEKLNQLVANSKFLYDVVDKPEELKGLSLAAAWGYSFPELKQKGELWKMAEPKEGVMSYVDNFVMGYSLQDNPLRKKIAEEWLNFILSPEYQAEVIVRDMAMGPVNLNIDHILTLEERESVHLDNPDFFEENRILWPTVSNARDRNGMQLLWDQAVETGKKK